MKLKRLFSGLLAAVMLVGLAVLPVGAASSPVPAEEAAQVINALGIMVGDANGNFHLSSPVTRAEFVTMAVNASGAGDQVGLASTSPYPDVPRSHWSAGYVEAGVKAGLISGYLDGTFRPTNQITLAEGATIALKLLGYGPGDFSGSYPTGQMAMYQSLNLGRGVAARGSAAVLTRQDTMYLFYNLLSTKTKTGQPYLSALGYALNAAGEVDRVALINSVMEGPVVASGSWQSAIPFDVAAAKVYRSGTAVSASAIQTNDVVYWCKPMRTLWVYTDRVTGAIQELSPSASNPSAVTVAGRSYPIETAAATYALSDLGSRRLGDTVTLLLGRTGGVAAVSSAAAIAADDSKVGLVTALSKGSYSGEGGSSYTADTVTLQATDGKKYSYQWSTENFKVGNLVQATVGSNGTVSLKRLSESGLSGRIPADGSAVGSYPFAADAEILDTYEGAALRVYPGRLAGVNLTAEMVRYYVLNGAGEITRLVLKDVTGDLHQYGIITDLQDNSADVAIMVNYTLDLAGQSITLSSRSVKYSATEGPFQMKGPAANPDKLLSLTSLRVDSLSGNTVTAASRIYRMSDAVAVYEYRQGDYYLSSLDRVRGGNYTLTAFYDKAETAGGCIRVLVAK